MTSDFYFERLATFIFLRAFATNRFNGVITRNGDIVEKLTQTSLSFAYNICYYSKKIRSNWPDVVTYYASGLCETYKEFFAAF